ncbi:MAG: thiol-disulfide isomerase [Bryobacteraceae bacterium]
MRAKLFSFALAACAYAPANLPAAVTYDRDVAPILRKNCQGCHRPGEAAPMSFLTYKETRPWASAIKEAVALKKMPPWFADPHYGKFSNDRSLAPNEIQTLVRWAETGAAEGKTRDLPKAAKFVDGWNIVSAGGKPDVEFEMPAEFKVPASGTIEYQYILIPGNFTEDKWVQRAEVRPGNRAVLHHVIAFVRPPGSKWMKDAQPGVPFVPAKGGGEGNGEFLVGYAPGTLPEILEPGRAKLIKAGSDFIFQMHYTANGKEGVDRSKIGLVFATEPVKERVYTLAAMNNKFEIPAGDANYQVDSSFEFGSEAKVVALFPHMHLRGKDFEYRAVYPTGEKEMLLNVPHYSFSWQLSYYPVKDLVMPKGTKIECTAHFDNSVNNPNNPDATKAVKWGDQSWEEMMIGFFDVAIDRDTELKTLFPKKKSAD